MSEGFCSGSGEVGLNPRGCCERSSDIFIGLNVGSGGELRVKDGGCVWDCIRRQAFTAATLCFLPSSSSPPSPGAWFVEHLSDPVRALGKKIISAPQG